MDALACYSGSDSGEPSSSGRAPEAPAQQRVRHPDPLIDSSDEDEQSEGSVDSAAERAAAAKARLRDFGGMSSKPPAKSTPSALPSATDVFSEVAGPPSFLDPEATRPLATVAALGAGATSTSDTAAAGSAQAGAKGRAGAGAGFDIAKLAPPLKGSQQQQSDKRGPPGATIEASAKRYKIDAEAPGQYSAAQIAMLGGEIGDAAAAATAGGAAARGKPTKPMAVTEFLDKGVGGAALPRRQQDRKDKEKKKREIGQSTHAHWKSEAEMVLRQQYDA